MIITSETPGSSDVKVFDYETHEPLYTITRVDTVSGEAMTMAKNPDGGWMLDENHNPMSVPYEGRVYVQFPVWAHHDECEYKKHAAVACICGLPNFPWNGNGFWDTRA